MSKYESVGPTRIDHLLGGDTIRYGGRIYKVVNTPEIYLAGEELPDTLMSFSLDDGRISGPIQICAFSSDMLPKVLYDDEALLAALMGE